MLVALSSALKDGKANQSGYHMIIVGAVHRSSSNSRVLNNAQAMLSRMLGLIRGIGKRVALHPKTSSKKYPRQFRMFLEGQDRSSTLNVTPLTLIMA